MKNTKSMEDHILVCKCDNSIFPLNMRNILNFLGDFSADGWWDWHIQEGFEYMSPKFWEILGYDYKTKSHSPLEWQDIIFPDDLKAATDNFNKHVQTKGRHPYYQHVRYRHKDGNTVWILCRGEVIEWDGKIPMRMIGTHTDITKEKELLDKSNKEACFFKVVFDHGLTASTIKDTKGIYERVNRKFCELTGFSKEELIGNSFEKLTVKDNIKEDREIITRLYNREVEFISSEKKITCKNGRIILCSVMQTLIDLDGEEKIYAQLVDISERRAIIEKINAIRKSIGSQ